MKFIPFTKQSPKCPKCGAGTKRQYCTANTSACPGYYELSREEHLDVACQECHFMQLQEVKTGVTSKKGS